MPLSISTPTSYGDMHNQTDGQRINSRKPSPGLGNDATRYQSMKRVVYGVNKRITTLSNAPLYSSVSYATLGDTPNVPAIPHMPSVTQKKSAKCPTITATRTTDALLTSTLSVSKDIIRG